MEKISSLLSSEKFSSGIICCASKAFELSDIEKVSNSLEELVSAVGNNFSRSKFIVRFTHLVSEFGRVHKFDGEERSFDAADFPETSKNAFSCLKIVRKLLETEFQALDSVYQNDFIFQAFILCATHGENHVWSSEPCIKLSKDLTDDIVKSSKYDGISDLLTRTNIFENAVKFLRNNLEPKDWMLNPSIAHIYYWFLTKVKHPLLGDRISVIFPPPFKFISHYDTAYKVLGLKSINHILDNVPATCLKMYGFDKAIYSNLFPMLYSSEYSIIEHYYPCILKLPSMSSNEKLWDNYDEVLCQLLRSAEMEGDISKKRLMLSHVLLYVKHRAPFNHLKQLYEGIFKTNIADHEMLDSECRFLTLEILSASIQLCWPRQTYHCHEILKFLINVKGELETAVTQAEAQRKLELEDLISKNLVLLMHSCGEKFKEESSLLIETNPGAPCAELIKYVLQKN